MPEPIFLRVDTVHLLASLLNVFVAFSAIAFRCSKPHTLSAAHTAVVSLRKQKYR